MKKLINVNSIEKDNTENNCSDKHFISPDGNCVLSCPNRTFQFFLNYSCLYFCPSNYDISNNKCILKYLDLDITLTEFKKEISEDIISYVNSSKVFNGTNFLAAVLSTDDMNPIEQLNNGISAIDLTNCTNIIKEYYNIPKNENLIVLNIESKNDESKKNESNINNDKTFNLGKNNQIEIYDYSGRKLNLSFCNENIRIMKHLGGVEQYLDMNSAKSLFKQGVDVFNKNDKFFNDICHPYENSDGKDIILNDRINEIYQSANFCQDGCTYYGINYDLNAANCICNSSYLQEDNIENNENEPINNNFDSFTKSFISNLISFNTDVLKCYNLAINIKILIHNIGFYCLSSMFIIQIIFFFLYLIKKLKPLKYFMLIFKINKSKNKYQKNKRQIIKNIKSNSQPKNNLIKSSFNGKKKYKAFTKRKKYIDCGVNVNQKSKLKIKDNILSSKNEIDSKNIILGSNNFERINNKKPIIDTNMNSKKETNFGKDNINGIIHNVFVKKQKFNIKNKDRIETTKNIISKINKGNLIRLSKTDSNIQELNYEEAIIYDKRSYLRIFWGFLVDSQIIFGTFCTDNYLDLFVIKLSFFVFTFQISFFLNAFFYTDEYISDAYHNQGVLDFFSGLPKSIYSFIATLITTNLLRMLSSCKNELMEIIRRNEKFDNYTNIINIKLAKLRKKLIIYFILIFLLESFFLYYVTVFCAVYRNSQKYWFFGCLESFGIDFLVAFIECIFLALFRYISIKYRIKCLYIFANIINTFL